MTIIQANDLIALFKRMAREHWRYEWGKAKEGAVDCSGAFVYAFKELGGLTVKSNMVYTLCKHMVYIFSLGSSTKR